MFNITYEYLKLRNQYLQLIQIKYSLMDAVQNDQMRTYSLKCNLDLLNYKTMA